MLHGLATPGDVTSCGSLKQLHMLPPSHPLFPFPLLWGAVAMVPSNSCIRHAQVAYLHIAWSV